MKHQTPIDKLLKALSCEGHPHPRTIANRREADGAQCHVTRHALVEAKKPVWFVELAREQYLPSCGTDMYVSQSTRNCPICTAPRATTLLVRNSIVCGPVRFSIIGNCCSLPTRTLLIVNRSIWSRRRDSIAEVENRASKPSRHQNIVTCFVKVMCRSAVHNLHEACDDVLMTAIRGSDMWHLRWRALQTYHETEREREREREDYLHSNTHFVIARFTVHMYQHATRNELNYDGHLFADAASRHARDLNNRTCHRISMYLRSIVDSYLNWVGYQYNVDLLYAVLLAK